MDGSERVILIKGDASKWYEQAIFIVKNNMPQTKVPVNFVAEAEKIIQSYMMRDVSGAKPIDVPMPAQAKVYASPQAAAVPRGKAPKRKRKKLDFVLNTAILLCCTTLIGVLCYMMLV